jgi:hypothetical protein
MCPHQQSSGIHCDITAVVLVHAVVFPEESQVTRNAYVPSYLEHPTMSKNHALLLSGAQNIADSFDLEPCPANLIWPSFGKVRYLVTRDGRVGPW